MSRTFTGPVLSVDLAARSFWTYDGPGPREVTVGAATFSGAGVATFDDLIRAYRDGNQVSVNVLGRDVDASTQATAVEVTRVNAARTLTFNVSVTKVLYGALWDGRVRSQLVYVLPWTVFRPESEFASWEAVKMALVANQRLCVAGTGYEMHAYAVQALSVDIRRARSEADTCSDR